MGLGVGGTQISGGSELGDKWLQSPMASRLRQRIPDSDPASLWSHVLVPIYTFALVGVRADAFCAVRPVPYTLDK